MLRLFRGTRNVNPPTVHPQLPSTLGEAVSCSDKPELDKDSYVQPQNTPHTTAIPTPPTPRTPTKSDAHLSQISQDTSDANSRRSDEHIDPNTGSPLQHATSSPITVDGVEPTLTPPLSQCYAQPRDSKDDQDATVPLKAGESTFPAVDLPVTQHDPTNSRHILKLLRRGPGGGATCLWQLNGGECGFSSQIDLVKRHIKRVHYRLRWAITYAHGGRITDGTFQTIWLPTLWTEVLQYIYSSPPRQLTVSLFWFLNSEARGDQIFV